MYSLTKQLRTLPATLKICESSPEFLLVFSQSDVRLRRVSESLRDKWCASSLGASGGSPPPLSTPLPPPSPQMSIGAFDSVLLRAPTAGRPCAPSEMGGEQGVWGLLRGGDPQRMSRKRLLNARRAIHSAGNSCRQTIHVRQHNSFLYPRPRCFPNFTAPLRRGI